MKNASVLLLLVLSSCSSKLYESNWRSTTEEVSAFRFYEAESKIRYNIENDADNLYFSFDVMDNLTVQKILLTGLRLFVDGSGKHKEKTEVQFPIYSDKVPITEYQQYATKFEQSKQLGKRRMDALVPADGYLKVDGKVTSIFNGSTSENVRVSLRFDSTLSLVYKVVIPLEILGELSNQISIGLETGGFEMPETEYANPNTDVTGANQGMTAGDRAMGRGTSNPYGVNSPGGSTAAGLALRNSTSYNRMVDPIRFSVKVRLNTSN